MPYNENNKYCNDMKEKIREILTRLYGTNLSPHNNGTKELLDLFSVSKRFKLDYWDKNEKEQQVILWATSENNALKLLALTCPQATYIFINKL